MTPTEHPANPASTSKAGLATLRGFLHVGGTGAPKTSRGLILPVFAAALAAVGAVVCALPGAALAAACPNEAIREQQGSTVLPECRAYEMVSPPYKADYGVYSTIPMSAALGGERVTFVSFGAFAGTGAEPGAVQYIARRGPGGWETSSTMVPSTGGRFPNGTEFNPELTEQVAKVDLAQNEGHDDGSVTALFTNDLTVPGSPFVQAFPLSGPPSLPGTMVSASPDLSHVVLNGNFGANELFEVAGVGGPTPVLSSIGGAELGGASKFHEISGDGSEVFFDSNKVRINGTTTLEVLPGGSFQGASEDGSKAFFTNAAGELEMAVIDHEPGHEAVTELVPISPGAGASVLCSSDDGSHVYFISGGVLTTGANAEGHSPKAGESNLYVYDTVTRETTFIAITGVASHYGSLEAQTTQNGRFLVFTTTARLTPDDTDEAADVYEYDASTGRLARVSAGEDGYDHNGNNSAFNASIAAPNPEANVEFQYKLDSRAVSDDGTVVFTTSEPLSPRAVNGQQDVYEWHGGQVGLISDGHSLTADTNPVITPSGRDIFFMTSEGLLPQDLDGLFDVYDARMGGGFPALAVSAGGCSGDACQGPPSVPSLLGAPASATFSGLGNPSAPASEPAVKPKAKPKAKPCKKGYMRKKSKCVKRPKAKKAGDKRRAGR